LQERFIIGIIISYLAGVAAESAAGAAVVSTCAEESAGTGAGASVAIVSTAAAVESAAGVLPPPQETKNIPPAITANANNFFMLICFVFLKPPQRYTQYL
jgi:hypothetical protein